MAIPNYARPAPVCLFQLRFDPPWQSITTKFGFKSFSYRGWNRIWMSTRPRYDITKAKFHATRGRTKLARKSPRVVYKPSKRDKAVARERAEFRAQLGDVDTVQCWKSFIVNVERIHNIKYFYYTPNDFWAMAEPYKPSEALCQRASRTLAFRTAAITASIDLPALRPPKQVEPAFKAAGYRIFFQAGDLDLVLDGHDMMRTILPGARIVTTQTNHSPDKRMVWVGDRYLLSRDLWHTGVEELVDSREETGPYGLTYLEPSLWTAPNGVNFGDHVVGLEVVRFIGPTDMPPGLWQIQYLGEFDFMSCFTCVPFGNIWHGGPIFSTKKSARRFTSVKHEWEFVPYTFTRPGPSKVEGVDSLISAARAIEAEAQSAFPSLAATTAEALVDHSLDIRRNNKGKTPIRGKPAGTSVRDAILGEPCLGDVVGDWSHLVDQVCGEDMPTKLSHQPTADDSPATSPVMDQTEPSWNAAGPSNVAIACYNCSVTFEARTHFARREWEGKPTCARCVGEFKQDIHRQKQITEARAKGLGIGPKCSCWQPNRWCPKHKHRGQPNKRQGGACLNCSTPK
jgi:hypothetical protein